MKYPLEVEDLLKRSEGAYARKLNWRQIYQDCYEYALPQRNLYDGAYEGGVPGQKKMGKVFDSTAIHSTQRFANRLQSGLFPPYGRWMRLEPGPDIPMDRRIEAQAALDIYGDKFFTVLRQSNFDLAMGEFLLDLTVGTAAMMVQPGNGDMPVRFQPVPEYLLAFDEGVDGVPENVYRRLRLKVETIEATWPDAELSDTLKRMLVERPTEDVDLLETTTHDTQKDEWHYCVIFSRDKAKIVHRNMRFSPWIISRYSKLAGEVYGRGPLVAALPDIKTLNKTVELLLKNASLAIAGVYTAADDGVLNPQTVRIVPGAIIPVARNGGPQGESLRPLARAGDFNVTQLVLQDIRMSVKKMLLDDTLPPDTMSARSATEIAERMKELATNLGSAFGRLITETMVPVVTKTLQIMDEAGLIDLPLKVNGLEVKVVPIAPIAQAQQMGEIEKTMQWYQISQQMGPEGQVASKPGEIVDMIADSLGIPARVRTTPEERRQKMEEMQQQQQAMMAMQVAQAGAQAGGGAPDQGQEAPAEPPLPGEDLEEV
jgi:hypothetical protein